MAKYNLNQMFDAMTFHKSRANNNQERTINVIHYNEPLTAYILQGHLIAYFTKGKIILCIDDDHNKAIKRRQQSLLSYALKNGILMQSERLKEPV